MSNAQVISLNPFFIRSVVGIFPADAGVARHES